MQDMLFPMEDSCIGIAQILDLILICRGDRGATVQDIIDSHQFTRWVMNERFNQLEARQRQMHSQSLELVSALADSVLVPVGGVDDTEAAVSRAPVAASE